MLSTRWFPLYATNLGQDCAVLNTSAPAYTCAEQDGHRVSGDEPIGGNGMSCEIILEVGAEGGTLALFGSKNDVGEWEFWTRTDEAAIFDLLKRGRSTRFGYAQQGNPHNR